MSKRAWAAKREREAVFDELNTLLVMFELPHLVGYGDASGGEFGLYRYRLYEGYAPFEVKYATDIEGLRKIVNEIITEFSSG